MIKALRASGARQLSLWMLMGALSMILSTAAFADDNSSGCGLGWQVSKKNSLVSSLIRSSTNATFSNTIAMTIGTSGCSQHSIVKHDKKQMHYAEANYHNLMVEMAQGKGEFLFAFAQVMGCQPAAIHAFGNLTQDRYNHIFPSGSDIAPEEMLNNLKTQMQNAPAVASACALSI